MIKVSKCLVVKEGLTLPSECAKTELSMKSGGAKASTRLTAWGLSSVSSLSTAVLRLSASAGPSQ